MLLLCLSAFLTRNLIERDKEYKQSQVNAEEVLKEKEQYETMNDKIVLLRERVKEKEYTGARREERWRRSIGHTFEHGYHSYWGKWKIVSAYDKSTLEERGDSNVGNIIRFDGDWLAFDDGGVFYYDSDTEHLEPYIGLRIIKTYQVANLKMADTQFPKEFYKKIFPEEELPQTSISFDFYTYNILKSRKNDKIIYRNFYDSTEKIPDYIAEGKYYVVSADTIIIETGKACYLANKISEAEEYFSCSDEERIPLIRK